MPGGNNKACISVTVLVATVCTLCCFFTMSARCPVAYDIDMARRICDSIPIEQPEGIWIYPDDNVTVLVLRDARISSTALQSYSISVIETSDCSLKPGDIIGKLHATPNEGKFKIELFTQRKKGILSNPRSCIATLSKDGETIILDKEEKSLKLRFSLNPSILLPKMWRIVRIGTSTSKPKANPPAGMVRIYPSYDGNGSSRRSPRYL